MTYLSVIFLFLFALIWHMIAFRISAKLKLIKPNYRNEQIMASYGIVSFIWIAAILASMGILGYEQWNHIKLYLAAMGAMWALGTIDDLFGTRQVGGFKGHFRKLFFEKKLTTGAIKALGGGIVGIVTASSLFGWSDLRWVPASMLIPLTANLLNLFDLRPGRAVAIFFFVLGVTYIWSFGGMRASGIIGAIALVALLFGIFDSRGKAMMGDSGSNSLGAALGLTIVLNTGILFQILAIAAIIAVNWYSEKNSITALIERNAVLRSIDRRLGVR